jgi:Mrp family chromosome partitioning ATPase
LPSLLGVTDVALGQARLDTALARVGVGDAASSLPATNGNTNGDHAVSAFVHVLAAGTIPPDPGEVVGWPAIGEILQELSGRMDYVLVDSPPLLSVGDPMTLSAHVDAVFLVLKSTVVRRPMVAEVRRQLDTSSVVALGFVLTQSESEEGYAYGDGYRYQHTPKAREADREALTT